MPIRSILAFVCVLSISVAIQASPSPPPPEPSCVDGIINQDETGFQYKQDQLDELTGTECGGPNCAPCILDYNTGGNRYAACSSLPQLANCIDGGGGNPAYQSFACTSTSCICNSYNVASSDPKGYWWDNGANNINGAYIVQNCDIWVEYCKENEYVDSSTSTSCEPCPTGTTRRAGDDPLRQTTACATVGPGATGTFTVPTAPPYGIAAILVALAAVGAWRSRKRTTA